MAKKIRILRSGNRIVVDSDAPALTRLLAPLLTYTEKKFYHGFELKRRRRDKLLPFEEVVWHCWAPDHRNRVGTSYGFYPRIARALRGAGYQPSIVWATPEDAAAAAARARTVYRPQWDRLGDLVAGGFKPRPGQRRCIELMAQYDLGRVDCPPAWGKGTAIMLACLTFAEAKVDVVVSSLDVLRTRLYPELCLNLPRVGIVGGGQRVTGCRVMCLSAGSLHHGREDADFVLVDEGHEACADRYAQRLGRYLHARMWAFSASWDMRLDSKDMRGEAMFGPVRLRVSYGTAEKQKLVVPIKVIWRNVDGPDPCVAADGTALDGWEKERAGVWANAHRNRLIAEDARAYSDDTQVLITVSTVEHGLHLKRLLPEFAFVYAGATLDGRKLRRFADQGLIGEDFTPMTDEQRWRLTQDFEAGVARKAIATSVWNVGVNFKQLEVLLRADAGGSPIKDTQIPGRTSRTGVLLKGGREVVKAAGVLHDYVDRFNKGLHRKSTGRSKSYERTGWQQQFPEEPPPAAGRQGGWKNV